MTDGSTAGAQAHGRTVGAVIDDAPWPDPSQGMVRVRFTAGVLTGAVIDLPEDMAHTRPGQLVLTDGGVYDRADNCRPVRSARVLRAPATSRPLSTPVVSPAYL